MSLSKVQVVVVVSASASHPRLADAVQYLNDVGKREVGMYLWGPDSVVLGPEKRRSLPVEVFVQNRPRNYELRCGGHARWLMPCKKRWR